MDKPIPQQQRRPQGQPQVREVDVKAWEREKRQAGERDKKKIRHAAQEEAFEDVAQAARPATQIGRAHV